MARQPSLPQQPAKIMPHVSALIALDSDLRGPGTITFEEGCIVHPKACIFATGGNILFGKDCVIEDGAAVINSGNDTMQIGEGNMFMVGSHVESHTIGNFNVFQPRSQVSPLVNISNHCTVSAGTTLLPAEDLSVVLKTAITSTPSTSQSGGAISEVETLPPYTVVYGAEGLRRTWDQASLAGEEALRTKHIEYLREILPKYNRMRPT